MFQSLISIVIVTYNNANVIGGCLEALYEQQYPHFEVVVVDNKSSDNTLELVRHYLGVTIIEAERNLGFAGGNKLGLTYCKGSYVVLLNPDTEPEKDWLEELEKCMRENPEAGIGGSKLVVHGTSFIDSAGDGCTSTARGFKLGEGKAIGEEQFCRTEFVFGACGGAMVIRSETIEHIGFLDEDFFLIYEDTDYCFRAQLAGWKVVYAAKAIVYHKVRSSIGVLSDLAVYYSIRNSKLVLFKNMPLKLIFKYFHHHILQELGSIVYFCIKHGKWIVYAKANINLIKMLPEILKKRKNTMALKVKDDEYIDCLLTPLWNKSLFMDKIKKIIS